jgi:hypothetical protein
MYSSSFQFSDAMDKDNDSDYIYFNANITNADTFSTTDKPDPVVRFQETRDVPILNDASKYVFSIIRFTMNGPNKDLPLFMPLIRTGTANPGNDVNLTIYSITLKANIKYFVGGSLKTAPTFYSTQPIIYETETQDLTQAPVPPASTAQTGQDVSTRYYWVYTYSHWLRLCNKALAAAYTDIDTQFAMWWSNEGGVGSAPFLTTQPPQISRNNTTNLFSLWGDRYGFGGDDRTSKGSSTDDEDFTLYFNNNMFGLFSNFDNIYVNEPGERTNQILFYNKQYQNIRDVASPPAPSAKSYWIMEQDYESTSTLWSPVENITFTSTLLPINVEQVGKPNVFGQGNDNISTGAQFIFQPIITDVALTNTSANDYREFIQYAPQAEYRLTSLTRSRTAINNLDIQVFWKNRNDGKLYPLTMFNSSSISIKIMFRRRGAENYPHPITYGKDT